jgi:MoxR-like ATPase
VVLSYEALADGVDADHVVDRIITAIQLPRITPGQDREPGARPHAAERPPDEPPGEPGAASGRGQRSA